MNSFYQRSSTFGSYAGNGLVILRNDDDVYQGGSYRLDESPFVPFNNEYDEDEFSYYRPRRADNYYGIRQEYLRSYTFTREEPKPEKPKRSLKRFKAVAWAVLCCKYRPAQAKSLREKLSSRSARFIHDSSDYLAASCRNFSVPSCLRLSSLDVA